jgi:hypothetical protein
VTRVELDGDRVRVGGRHAEVAKVARLEERFGRWTGRARLVLVGTALRVPIGPGYGRARARIRAALHDRPFVSDWMDGRFPSIPGGLPPDLATAIAIAAAAVAAIALGAVAGAELGLVAALLSGWPIGRLRDAWVVRADGLRGGPPWAALVPWHDVASVHVRIGRRRALLWTRGPGGGHAASLPIALLPAFRARVRRLGGLDLIEGEPGLEDRYLRWRAPAVGFPWGIGAGCAVAAALSPAPWTVLIGGAAAMAATALLGAMVTLRAGGWGAGSVFAGTLLYGLLLLVAGLVAAGWVGGS